MWAMNGRNNQIVSRPAEGDDQRSWVVPGSRPQNCQPTDNDHVRCVSVFENLSSENVATNSGNLVT